MGWLTNISRNPRQLLSGLTLAFPLGIFALDKSKAGVTWSLALTAVAIAIHLDWKSRRTILIQIFLLVLIMTPVALLEPHNLPRIYPFLVSATVLGFFLRSQKKDVTALESFAGAVVPLDDFKRQSLRASMPIWIWGMSFNTAILFVFIFGFSTEAWALYAGFLSYLFLILLFLATAVKVHFRPRKPNAAQN